jgi:peptide/nickel transport system permease protein
VSWRYLGRRLLQIPPVVAVILLVTFLMIHLAPGDPVEALAGEGGDLVYYQFIRQKFGLDRPLPEQLWAYASNVFRADLGFSLLHQRPVLEVILERLPATLLLVLTATVISTFGGIVIGALAARRRFGAFDLAANVTILTVDAAPSFLLGQLALLILAFQAGLFPIHGMTDPRVTGGGIARAVDVARHMTLPALVLASDHVANVARMVRASLITEMGKQYVKVARAKGLSERAVVMRHALPNALLPAVTIIAGRVAPLFTAAAIVEIVFGWPGLGRLLLGATHARDYPLILGIFLFVSLVVIVANLLTDFVYARLDPRITY